MTYAQCNAIPRGLLSNFVVHIDRINIGTFGQIVVIAERCGVAFKIQSDDVAVTLGIGPGREDRTLSERNAGAKLQGPVLQVDIMAALVVRRKQLGDRKVV